MAQSHTSTHDIKEKATGQFERMADKAADQFRNVADQAEAQPIARWSRAKRPASVCRRLPATSKGRSIAR